MGYRENGQPRQILGREYKLLEVLMNRPLIWRWAPNFVHCLKLMFFGGGQHFGSTVCMDHTSMLLYITVFGFLCRGAVLCSVF